MTSTTDIKASEVQKLRQMTGAGLMDCKQALTQAKGDLDQAVRLLRERGIAQSSQRADRVAAEGLVDAWLSSDQKEGILLELNCETDFVARNEEFVSLAKTMLGKIKDNPTWKTADQIPIEAMLALSSKVGEKISVKRFVHYQLGEGGVVGTYIHPGSKLAVLLKIDSNKPGTPSEELKNLAKELALQVAGASPTYVRRSDVPAEVIEREKEIAKKQMEGQKKTPEVLEKIAMGKLQQFYAAHCLVDQPHVRDASGKTRVQDLIENLGKKEGAQHSIAQFVRFRVGAD